MSQALPSLSHRANNYDFLRFFLAAVVILTHSFDLLSGDNKKNPFMIATHGQIELGTLAVGLFFILSGYLITQSFVMGRGVLDFFKKRVLRIYPAFVVVCLLSLFVFSPLGYDWHGYFRPVEQWGFWGYVDFQRFTFHVATLQQLWAPQTFKHNPWPYVNSAIWTIHYEFACYVLVAVLGVLGVLRKRTIVLGLFLVVWAFHVWHHMADVRLYGYQGWFDGHGWADFRMWGTWIFGGKPDAYPRFVTYFLAGSVAFLYRDKIRYTDGGAALAATAAGLTLFMLGGAEFVLPVAAAYMLFWFGQNPAIGLHNWGKFGDFSYGLYVFGWPVQQSVIHFLGRGIHPLTLFAISFAVTMVFAVGSWYAVERPFLRMKRKRPAPPAVAAGEEKSEAVLAGR